MKTYFVASFIIIIALTACARDAQRTTTAIKPVSCENSFAVTDHNQAWLFDLKPKKNEIFEAFHLKYEQRSSVSQANYLCRTKELALGYAYRGRTGRDAGIDFIGERSMSNIELNPDGFNYMYPIKDELFVYTALLKRDKRDRHSVTASTTGNVSTSIPPSGYRPKGVSSAVLANRTLIDMLVVSLPTHSIDRKIQFPAVHDFPIWTERDNFVLYNPPPLTINSRTGYAAEIMHGFRDFADFQLFRRHDHYFNGTFYVIVGARKDPVYYPGTPTLKQNAIYALNNSTGNWDKIATLNFQPVHVTGFQNEIVIVGRDSFAHLDVTTKRLVTEQRNFEGMIAAACAWLKDGRVLVLSHTGTRSNTYGGGEIWVYDTDWKRVIAKRKMEDVGLPAITSQRSPLPSGMTDNSL